MAHPGGRPPIEINQKQFENLCGLQCTKEEIADFFNCSEDTIDRWCQKVYGKSFAVVFREKRNGGKISLRRKQWLLADKSPAMAIFLGKNYLGQTDNVVIDNPAQTSAIEQIAKIVLGGNKKEEDEDAVAEQVDAE